MAPIVSKTVIARARKHLNTAMRESARIIRTNVSVPCLVIVETKPIIIRGMPNHLRLRKWNIVMPAPETPLADGLDVRTGDRIAVTSEDGSPRGTFIVTELTGPDTFNVSSTVLAVLSNATVSFNRGSATTGAIEVFISRISNEEKAQGILYDWEVWFDSSIRYPNGTSGGTLVSKQDEMHWARSPNPFPKGGNAILDAPRYAYAEDALVAAYFKETL